MEILLRRFRLLSSPTGHHHTHGKTLAPLILQKTSYYLSHPPKAFNGPVLAMSLSYSDHLYSSR
jgi:hypothetical protein